MNKLLGVLVLILGLCTAFTHAKKEECWDFTVPSAPYVYNTGTLCLSHDGEQWKGDVHFPGMPSVTLENISYKEKVLRFEVVIDNETARVVAQVKEEQLEGNVALGYESLSFTAAPQKNKKDNK